MRKIIMKIIPCFLTVLSIMLVSTFSMFAQPIPEDSMYLEQQPPGNTPKIFNLPITNRLRPLERIAITSNGKEIYFGELNTYPPSTLRVRCYKYEENKWQGPFNVFEGFMAPKFSGDDSVLYLQDNNFYTYYSERTMTGWSVPVRLFSKNLHTHYFQKTNLNKSYASSYYEGSTTPGDLCELKIFDQDTILQSLGVPLNSTSQENDFIIAQDESFIIVSRNLNSGSSDMYLSFRRKDGKWTNPKKLEEPINKPGYNWEYGQFISSDGKYLFFTSGGLSWSSYFTYWVRIDNIIDSLKHTNYIPYLNLQIPNQAVEKNQLFNYTIPDSIFIDDDGNNTLTYSAELSDGNSLPSWSSFNPSTRTFTGTPTEAVNLAVKVTAADTENESVYCVFNIYSVITDLEDSDEQVPKSGNLLQNYPNPFNPATTIEFTIPLSGRYTLKLCNVLGETVKEISDKEYEIGSHKETLDASELSGGIYIYSLTGENVNNNRKMVILH